MLTSKSTGFILLPIILIVLFFLKRSYEHFTTDEDYINDVYLLYNNQHLDIRDNFTDLYKFNSYFTKIISLLN